MLETNLDNIVALYGLVGWCMLWLWLWLWLWMWQVLFAKEASASGLARAAWHSEHLAEISHISRPCFLQHAHFLQANSRVIAKYILHAYFSRQSCEHHARTRTRIAVSITHYPPLGVFKLCGFHQQQGPVSQISLKRVLYSNKTYLTDINKPHLYRERSKDLNYLCVPVQL